MEDNNYKLLEDANAEFKRENFKIAEELYTKLISSCLQTRYSLLEALNQPVAVTCNLRWCYDIFCYMLDFVTRFSLTPS